MRHGRLSTGPSRKRNEVESTSNPRHKADGDMVGNVTLQAAFLKSLDNSYFRTTSKQIGHRSLQFYVLMSCQHADRPTWAITVHRVRTEPDYDPMVFAM